MNNEISPNISLTISLANLATVNQTIKTLLDFVAYSTPLLFDPALFKTLHDISISPTAEPLDQMRAIDRMMDMYRMGFDSMHKLLEFLRRSSGRKFPSELIGVLNQIIHLPGNQINAMSYFLEVTTSMPGVLEHIQDSVNKAQKKKKKTKFKAVKGKGKGKAKTTPKTIKQKSLPKPKEPDPTEMKYECLNCHTIVGESEKICPKCGDKLID